MQFGKGLLFVVPALLACVMLAGAEVPGDDILEREMASCRVKIIKDFGNVSPEFLTVTCKGLVESKLASNTTTTTAKPSSNVPSPTTSTHSATTPATTPTTSEATTSVATTSEITIPSPGTSESTTSVATTPVGTQAPNTTASLSTLEPPVNVTSEKPSSTSDVPPSTTPVVNSTTSKEDKNSTELAMKDEGSSTLYWLLPVLALLLLIMAIGGLYVYRSSKRAGYRHSTKTNTVDTCKNGGGTESA